jgi:hypothetical protein
VAPKSRLKPLEPPDKKQCQADVPNGTNFGRVDVLRVRCTTKPIVIVKEKKPGADGRRGSMSLCGACLTEFQKTGTEVTVTLIRATRRTRTT